MSSSTDDHTVVIGATPPGQRPPSHGALAVGTQLNEFEITGLVGEGGFGIVYLANDLSLQREVAIKEYMPSSLAVRADDSKTVIVRSERHSETFEIGRNSFVNEARLLAQFDHPALVKVFRFWESNGTAYMAMPFFRGKTLRDVLRARATPPDEAWIRRILLPVMEALELIHASQCFHRDIAPDNIMLLADERPVLLDFGAARRVIGDMTQALTVILKPGYAPIEQYAEIPGMKQGAWTDIYALGAVIYFMVTGKTPPPAVGRMVKDSYEPLATLAQGRYSETFLNGVDRCLSVACEARPQNVAEMRSCLGFDQATVAGAPTTAAAGATPAPTPAPPSATQASPRETQHETRRDEKPAAPAAEPAREPRRKPSVAVLAAAGVVTVGALFGLSRILFPSAPQPAPAPQAQPAPAETPATPATAPPPSVSASPATPSSVAMPPPEVTTAPTAPSRPVALTSALDDLQKQADGAYGISLSRSGTAGASNLSIQAQKGGYVYAFVWDTTTDRLTPVTTQKGSNRLRPGVALALKAPPGVGAASRVIALVSASPRDLENLGLGKDAAGEGLPRADLEARLGSTGMPLAGVLRCAEGTPCPNGYGALVMEWDRIAIPAPSPAAKAPADQAKAAQPRSPGSENSAVLDAEKKYIRDLNKGLDRLLDQQK